MKKSVVLFSTVLLVPGCFSQARAERTSTDRITFQVKVPIPTADGVKVVPMTGTIRRVGTEQEEVHSGPDVEAYTQAAMQGVETVATGAFPWTNLVGGVGAAITAAMTAYLALKKREQMKTSKPSVKAGGA